MRQIFDLSQVENQQDYLRYNRDVTHSYSPAAQKLISLALDHFEMAFQDVKNGRKVVWCNAQVTPLVYACGYTPLQGADISRYGNPYLIDDAERRFQIPAECCAMMKGILGGLYEYRNTGVTKFITTGQRCEAEFTALAIAEKFGYEICLLENYKRPKQKDRARLVEETFRRDLENVSEFLIGEPINKQNLLNEFARINRVRDKLVLLLEKQKKHRNYYKTIPIFLVLTGAENYFGQQDYFEEIVDEMLAELDALGEGEYDEGGVPIVWSGVRGVDFSVYNAVDMVGGYVAAWNLPTDIDKRYDLNADPIEQLVDKARAGRGQRNMQEACAYDQKLVEESNAKGIILYSTLGCTLTTVNTAMKRDYLSSVHKPVLVVNGTAQIGEITGQLMTRMKAFIEMIA